MKIIIFALFFLINFNLFSQEIRTIDLIKIINDNKQYNNFLDLLDFKKKKVEANIADKEKNILINEKFIENNKLIINTNDLNERIELLSQEYFELESYMNKYNYYFDKNMNINKNILLNIVAEICKNLSILDKIDIIFDKSNYFIASNHIDLTDVVLLKIDNIDIEFNLFTEEEIFEN